MNQKKPNNFNSMEFINMNINPIILSTILSTVGLSKEAQEPSILSPQRREVLTTYLKEEEGLGKLNRPGYLYNDHEGHPTIGIGHLVHENSSTYLREAGVPQEHIPAILSGQAALNLTQMEALLQHDINRKLPEFTRIMGSQAHLLPHIPDENFAALFGEHFRGAFAVGDQNKKRGSPKALEAVNRGDFVEAMIEFLDRTEYFKASVEGKEKLRNRMLTGSRALTALGRTKAELEGVQPQEGLDIPIGDVIVEAKRRFLKRKPEWAEKLGVQPIPEQPVDTKETTEEIQPIKREPVDATIEDRPGEITIRKSPRTSIITPAPETPVAKTPIKPKTEMAAEMTKRVDAPSQAPLAAVDSKGGVKSKITADIADTEPLRKKGLSKKSSIPDDYGMFFTKVGSFWMKDCLVPLDIIFMNKQGNIVDKKTMPISKLPDILLPSYKSKDNTAVYALETKEGWAKKNNINIGDKVRVNFK